MAKIISGHALIRDRRRVIDFPERPIRGSRAESQPVRDFDTQPATKWIFRIPGPARAFHRLLENDPGLPGLRLGQFRNGFQDRQVGLGGKMQPFAQQLVERADPGFRAVVDFASVIWELLQALFVLGFVAQVVIDVFLAVAKSAEAREKVIKTLPLLHLGLNGLEHVDVQLLLARKLCQQFAAFRRRNARGQDTFAQGTGAFRASRSVDVGVLQQHAKAGGHETGIGLSAFQAAQQLTEQLGGDFAVS